jgi:hypothetical protein
MRYIRLKVDNMRIEDASLTQAMINKGFSLEITLPQPGLVKNEGTD